MPGSRILQGGAGRCGGEDRVPDRPHALNGRRSGEHPLYGLWRPAPCALRPVGIGSNPVASLVGATLFWETHHPTQIKNLQTVSKATFSVPVVRKLKFSNRACRAPSKLENSIILIPARNAGVVRRPHSAADRPAALQKPLQPDIAPLSWVRNAKTRESSKIKE
jgi:hypothetical protein